MTRKQEWQMKRLQAMKFLSRTKNIDWTLIRRDKLLHRRNRSPRLAFNQFVQTSLLYHELFFFESARDASMREPACDARHYHAFGLFRMLLIQLLATSENPRQNRWFVDTLAFYPDHCFAFFTWSTSKSIPKSCFTSTKKYRAVYFSQQLID